MELQEPHSAEWNDLLDTALLDIAEWIQTELASSGREQSESWNAKWPHFQINKSVQIMHRIKDNKNVHQLHFSWS